VNTVDKVQTIHQVVVQGGEPVISLHIYSRPIDSCVAFDLAQRRCYRRELSYYSKYGDVVVREGDLTPDTGVAATGTQTIQQIARAFVGHFQVGDQARQDVPRRGWREMARLEPERAAERLAQQLLTVGHAQRAAAIEWVDQRAGGCVVGHDEVPWQPDAGQR